MRTILYSTENVTVSSTETMLFLACLLVFATIASGYVMSEGLRAGQATFRLVLSCTLIISSVVPPELPVELSLAVNNSLLALAEKSTTSCTLLVQCICEW